MGNFIYCLDRDFVTILKTKGINPISETKLDNKPAWVFENKEELIKVLGKNFTNYKDKIVISNTLTFIV